MTHYRRVVLGALAWVAIVSVGAFLVWTVISEAGAGVAGNLPVTTTTTTTTDSGGQTTSAPPSATQPASPSTSAPQQPAGPVRRSWQGAAGAVVASCDGSAIALVSARPNSGWSIEVDHTGPDDLRVEFESGGDGRVRVEAACAGGTPSFVVDAD